MLLLNTLHFLLVLALLQVPDAGYAQGPSENPVQPSVTPMSPISFSSKLQTLLSDPLTETVNAGRPHIFEQDNWGYAIIDTPDTHVDHHEFEVYLGRYKTKSGWVIISSRTTSAQIFNALLQHFPETLMDEATKAFLTRLERPLAMMKFSGHKFPWPSGQTGYVTRKNGNDHENQIDFDILGNGTNGDVYASKPGRVVFVKESQSSPGWCSRDAWKRANMVVIKHSDNEYSWYVHLAHNSVPVSVEQDVGWGTKIGVEGNTGYSCGVHLHFHVSSGHTRWTDPNNANDAPWATGINAVDFDEVRWDNIGVGPYTSQNRSGDTTPPSNRSPNRPSPSIPGDWHAQRDGRAPTLCWNDNGDPDGDRLQFYAEVFDSARNANSGWQDGTCWRPGSLDGNYFNYQWRIKARDNRGGESGWSDVRRFTIESPNQPPTTSFNTANGNGDSRITTREQNWTFQGTANDPEGQLSRVEFRCNDCDNAGSGQSSSTSTSWSITRNGMSGRNYVYFEAYDDRQSARSAKTLELNIDLVAPTTDIQINGKSPDSWPAWFNEAAQVRLTGRDNGTGRAVADVREMRYRRDSGSEQAQSGGTVNFTESSDGEHTVHYYAIDNVSNVESERSVTYRVDRTPPTGISGLQESSSVVNNQWQKNQNKPIFTWNASSDAHSGLGGYQFYFGTDANGTSVHFDVAANTTRTLTPNNLGVATGTYHLRGRTWDNAGNTSDWQTLFVFRYDGTPPPNPGQATHINGPKNDTWQKITAQANFTWTVPMDEGSGIKGYLSYWGTDTNGESANLLTANSLQSATPLCAQGEACTGYLRLRSQDNVDHNAEKWTTTFVLRYDGAPPVADFTVNGGVTQTAQTLMTLDLQATDLGSGLREMRFSSDGQNWTNWESYADSRPWEVPAISRQFWPIYLQVKDTVGWESAVISRTIYFDVNAVQPRSDNYRLFNYVQVAGAGAHTSQPTGYQGHSTVGQVHDSPRITSTSYSLASGYEAGSRAIPLVVPGHDEFEFINGIFASGVVNSTMQSGQYRLIGVWGEPALPNNRTEIASSNYRLQPGFLAARPSAQGMPSPTATPTPSPTPTPTPTPACEFPRVSINEGAVFATGANVNLNLCAPNVNEMMVSNDGGFSGAMWEPYARNKAWTLTSHSNYVLPRFVYVAFRDAVGQIYATYLDDIILDPNPPDGKVRIGSSLPLNEAMLLSERTDKEGNSIFRAQGVSYLWRVDGRSLDEPLPILAASADGAIDLYLSARDQVGNVTGMQVSENGFFSDTWESYSALKLWTPEGGDGAKTIYARFRDEAGNTSAPFTATFALDTQPPIGGIALSHPILGPDVVTTTIWLGAEDNLSGVVDMRLSTDPNFADAVWRPFAATSTWIYSQIDRNRSKFYVQFRDYVGNESEILNAPLFVDNLPPLVYVEVEEGETSTRTVHIYSYDELTYPDQMRLTNDPLFLDGVVTQAYSETVSWTFDERHVVWVQIKDAVGNWSEAWPAYDGSNKEPTPTTPTPTTPTPTTPTPTTPTPTTPTPTTPTPTTPVLKLSLYLPFIQRSTMVGATTDESANANQFIPIPTEEPILLITPVPMALDNQLSIPSINQNRLFLPLVGH